MKTKLLKLALCAMALLPMVAWADIDFGSQATVSTTTNWTFGELTAETAYSSYTNINGLYLRTNQSGRSFTVKSFVETDMVYGDKYHLPSTNYLYVNNNATYSGSDALTATSTAGDNTSTGRGMIAINATVAGTMYVKIKGTTSDKVIRFYFADGTTITGGSGTSITSDGTIQEISYTSTTAGSFFVGGITTGTSEIYGVRFVPTSEKPADIVYIGSTGYASYGNNTGSHLTLPDGLTAYKAKADAGGHSVTLTAVTGIRSAAGYILKGTVNTNYSLTSTATDPAGGSGNELKRTNVAIANFPATEGTGDDTKYNYILGADGTTAKFFAPNATSTLAAGKAYLQTATQLTPAGARGIDIIFENETTGVADVKSKMEDVRCEYFDLQGRKVAQPTKGLYIVNGKKVIIK